MRRDVIRKKTTTFEDSAKFAALFHSQKVLTIVNELLYKLIILLNEPHISLFCAN